MSSRQWSRSERWLRRQVSDLVLWGVPIVFVYGLIASFRLSNEPFYSFHNLLSSAVITLIIVVAYLVGHHYGEASGIKARHKAGIDERSEDGVETEDNGT